MLNFIKGGFYPSNSEDEIKAQVLIHDKLWIVTFDSYISEWKLYMIKKDTPKENSDIIIQSRDGMDIQNRITNKKTQKTKKVKKTKEK